MPVQLAKALLVDTESGDRIPVMYNPEEYRLDAGNEIAEIAVPGLPAPPLQYVRGRARVLSMELFFDSYERGEDVRRHTQRIVGLLTPKPATLAPPVLLFVMGAVALRCLLVEANQRYTMFDAQGTPVRAVLTVRLQEFTPVEVRVERGLFAGPPAGHVLAAADTLSGLAGQYLGDPGRWRELAEANGLDDPLDLPVGRALSVTGGAP